ncbi:MAG: hypothetical protein ABSF09_06635 [Candidatus Bathyarchaeia archaeon]
MLSQSNESSQPAQSKPGKSSGSLSKRVGIGLTLLAVLSLAIAGFSVLNPQVTTVTQQQFITSVRSVSKIQAYTTNSMVTVVMTATSTLAGSGFQQNTQTCGYSCLYPNSFSPNCGTNSCAYPTCGSNGCSFQLCGPNGCSFASPGYTAQQCGYNGCYYSTCQSTSQGTVQCAGYLYQNNSGCVELVVPVANYASGVGSTTATQYYTLHNLPASYPSIGSWVKVAGQLYMGNNTSSNGTACPGNYINVSSIA